MSFIFCFCLVVGVTDVSNLARFFLVLFLGNISICRRHQLGVIGMSLIVSTLHPPIFPIPRRQRLSSTTETPRMVNGVFRH